ncbi:hypothetical protein KUTeg_003079 [Tegillarca granosa]|uniref:Aminopeptidase n=1 Tax=Tegillarca granosa TaxID=220873 RepID=A0ABQ9FL30_TEGGR|nr:hypothetical protein KUTeg_003079 [Tegillarca granosa]
MGTQGNKRLIYFLVFLLIIVPVIVGVVVWHLTRQNCKEGTTVKSTTNPAIYGTEPWTNLRLPKSLMPVHYDITLFPDFYDGNGWFYGNESIELKVKQQTTFIMIHFYYMNITKTELRKNGTNEIIKIKRTFPYKENQFWVIETEEPMRAGLGIVLDLQFDGSLTRAIVGLYKSTYVNSITKERRYLAASKFEPVSARRAFPCFDEPNIKAEYTVRLVHKQEYTALSNMPDMHTSVWQHDPHFKITTFQRSVKMSTYLVCFIVCDFEYLNMIAIPDFVSGAMEHWGLITYRETAMLFDPREASSANKQRVAVVVAHELAHQWFGNIVTMDWWDDLWLNEGFASFMEYFGANKSEPDWEMLSQFLTEDVQPVMITDAGVSSHPIVVDVTNPSQINEVFDSISYSKGSAVIRMLESIMGKQKFFKGIEAYLKAFAWGNAKTENLWNKLGNIEDGLSVRDVMDTWTRQMGLPYINIVFDSKLNKATATQKRFLADKTTKFNENRSPYRYKWYVLLDYITSSSETGKVWIKKQETITFDIPVNPIINKNAWIKFNREQTGFYRVNYPDDVWRNFASELNKNPEIMKDTDKSGLINDALNLARGGYLSYDIALEITTFLDKEYGYLPWKSAIEGLEYIEKMLMGSASWKSHDSEAADWDTMMKRYISATVPQEKIKLLYGMAQTKNIQLLHRYVDYAKNESLIRSQDFFSVLQYIAGNPVGTSIVWNWIRSNWDYLISRKYPEAGSGARGREQALESIKRNIIWVKKNKQIINDWICVCFDQSIFS